MESVESDKGPTLKDWVEFILCIAVMSGIVTLLIAVGK